MASITMHICMGYAGKVSYMQSKAGSTQRGIFRRWQLLEIKLLFQSISMGNLQCCVVYRFVHTKCSDKQSRPNILYPMPIDLGSKSVLLPIEEEYLNHGPFNKISPNTI